ncbi:AMP-dependent synthetase, partial [Sulfolobus sp. B5]
GKEIKLYTELSDIIIKRNDEFDYDRKYDNFEWIESNEPLKIMYTSGTTGKPKGIILPHGSWMVGDYTVFDLMFSLKPNDIVLTTTDVGWITFSRIMYGTLTHGSTLAFLEGAPDFPDNRLANIIDELQPKVLFTSPTLLRNLQKLNVKLPKVEFVATAGEIMDETAWKYALSFSDKVTDVYGQTELGYVVGYPYSLEGISPKVGYAGLPFPGSVMDTLDEAGKSVRQEVGYLVSKTPFPTQFIGVWNDNEKFLSYFKRFNYHDTGDLAIIDAEGYIKIVGRNDDMIKVAGHRITSGEVESVINSINGVVESAVVGIPDEIKGEKLVVFYVGSAEEKEIISSVKKLLGPIYVIDKVYRVERLPKSRSGKIVRRILRDILLGKEVDETILEDGEVIKEIKNEISRS